MTEETGGAGASLEDVDAYEQFAPLEMGASELPVAETQPVEQPPEAQATAPAETPAESQPQPPAQPVAAQQPQEDAHRVPLRELLDERERRQALQRQLEAFQRQQQQAQEQRQRPDFWEQPENSIEYQIAQRVAPLEQRLIAERENLTRAIAEMQHGKDKVDGAFEAMKARLYSGDPAAQFEYQRVMTASNPYSALVQWDQQQKALAEIGTDPSAYRQKALDEALKDPAFLARAVEAARSHAASNPSAVAFTTPPKSKGVPSISNIGGAGSVSAGLPDFSDDDAFEKYAPR